MEKWENVSGSRSELLASKPQLGYYSQVVWDAFRILNSARGYNMGGPQRLVISEITSYLKEVGLIVEDGLLLVLALDETWMDYFNAHHRDKK